MPLPDVTFPNTPEFYHSGVYISARPSRQSPEEIVKSLNTAHDNLRKQISFDSQIRRGCIQLKERWEQERKVRIGLTITLAVNLAITFYILFR